MRFRPKIWPLLILLSAFEFSCGSRQRSPNPPDVTHRDRLDLENNAGPGAEGAAPAPTFATEAERRNCLERQEKTLESLGWDRGRGVEGVIDLLLDETQQANPIPLCTP